MYCYHFKGFGSEQSKDVIVKTTTAPSGDVKEKPREDVRIPAGFTPFHYNIELRPHIYRSHENICHLSINGYYLLNTKF